MKTITLETILKKLIRQNLINYKSILKINYDELPYSKAVNIECKKLTNSILSLPVLDIYVGWGDILGIKQYAKLDKTPIEFRFTHDDIVDNAKKEKYINSERLNDGYFFYIVLKKLPHKYLKSYIYQENFVNYSLFLTLLNYKNTIMTEDTYNKALNYIKRNKKTICKKYNIKPNYDGKLKIEHVILEKSISKICGFDIRIRKVEHGVIKLTTTYIIEKCDDKK